jgi:hypothetical protein
MMSFDCVVVVVVVDVGVVLFIIRKPSTRKPSSGGTVGTGVTREITL